MSEKQIAGSSARPDFPEWGLFCDFHTMRECRDVGSLLDVPRLIAALRRCGIDYLTVAARCNQGFAYCRTEAGIPHPGANGRDIFGEIVSGCRKEGIFISGYINVGISEEEYQRRPDWRVIPPAGSDLPRLMCVNSGYGDHLCAMTEEIVSRYDVTGMFFDCVYAPPCDCPHCREKKMSPAESRKEMISRLAEIVRRHRPEAMIYFNSMPAEDQLDKSNYLELECLPNGGWTYESFPLQARYLRNFGRPVFGMSGRFHRSWGDFGGLRSAASLTYDCASALANGLRVTVGTHLHPTMALNDAVVELIEGVYGELGKHAGFCRGAQPRTEVALVVPGKNLKENSPENMASAYGGCRMLQESGMQFDVVTAEMEIPPACRLLLLADDVRLTAEKAGKFRNFIASGGAVIATGRSGMDPDGKAFVLPELGALSRTVLSGNGHYIRAGFPGIPDMPVALYSEGAVYTPARGSRVLARGEAPYFDLPSGREASHIYLPPGGGDEGVVMGRYGRCIYCATQLCSDYFHFAQLPLRALMRAALRELLPQPLTDTGGLPPWVRTTVTEQPGRTIIHLLSFIPERRGECFDVVESAVPAGNAVVGLRLDGREPRCVYLSPDRKDRLSFTIADGYLRIGIPGAAGYTPIVTEWKNIP
ncbi:MAG: hypothetical protein IJU70_11810 [Lentisphaeria bacterium]|nr:hypothetical protein [Lentisphaeria bacterium]